MHNIVEVDEEMVTLRYSDRCKFYRTSPTFFFFAKLFYTLFCSVSYNQQFIFLLDFIPRCIFYILSFIFSCRINNIKHCLHWCQPVSKMSSTCNENCKK